MTLKRQASGSVSTCESVRKTLSLPLSPSTTTTTDYLDLSSKTRKYSIDVLLLLSRGTRFLKLCSSGRAHFRFFHLDVSSLSLVWSSWFKPSSATTIPLSRVISIEQGHSSSPLFKSQVPYDLSPVSFSLTYLDTNGEQKTLSLVAEDAQTMITWYSGIEVLSEYAKQRKITEGERKKTLRRMFVALPILSQNVSYRSLLDQYL